MTSRKEETAMYPMCGGRYPSSPEQRALLVGHVERSLRGDDRTIGRLQAHG
ncbi:hypothetical protein [Nocardia aurantiaca]|uniref:Uncharacterized protein n=1 Tax=Nocardia aurantiaca TaxID=2675850 RepID=A0A6I3L1U9_9NOCA|nr:hypothetical protein [Nocardia aurantiaca]MTE14584.1 hypothetical protein [Nocardia aurantiaca]